MRQTFEQVSIGEYFISSNKIMQKVTASTSLRMGSSTPNESYSLYRLTSVDTIDVKKAIRFFDFKP